MHRRKLTKKYLVTWLLVMLQVMMLMFQMPTYAAGELNNKVITDVAAGTKRTMFLIDDGTVWGAGRNLQGQLGDGTQESKSDPVQVTGLTSVTDIAAGDSHTLFLLSDGTIFGVGAKGAGQLGDGSTSPSVATTLVQASGTNYTAVTAGYGTSMGLKDDGTVWTWGSDQYGKLGNGDGSSANVSTPTQVAGLSNIVAIEIGNYSCFAIDNTGSIWAWGRNDYGQLGTDNGKVDITSPTKISGTSGFVEVVGGTRHTLARKSDGTLYAWGSGSSYQLGNGDNSERLTPTQVTVIDDVKTMAVGTVWSIAVKNDGTVWGWGNNSYGQLGIGSNASPQQAAVQMSNVTNAIAVDCGMYHTAVATSVGSTFAVGLNDSGQLTDGTEVNNNNPTSINPSSNANLSALSLSAGTLSPSFASLTTTYTASVPYATSSMTVTPTLDDARSSMTVNGEAVSSGSASGSIALGVGSNVISVVVTAEDSTQKTYTVTVTRAAASTDANLSSLSFSSGSLSPVFASGTTSYTASVGNDVTSITATPTLSDSKASVTVNGVSVSSGNPSGSIALSVGDNTITTVVTAEDGTTTKTYTVTVNRAQSSNANLSALTTSEGSLSPAFASGTTSYSVSVGNAVTSTTFTPTVEDGTASITVNGSSVTSGSPSGSIALGVGDNDILVVVTAEDTSTKTYTITVNRAASTNNNLSNLTLSSGTLSPSFASGTTGYTASVGNAVTSISVTPTVDDGTATVTVNGSSVTSGSPSGSIALSVGDNTITVVVTAQDSSTKSYAVTVNRAPSSNANLSVLTLSSGALSPSFASGTTGYTASVGNAVTSITVTPTVDEANATVTVNGSSVTSGSQSGSIALSVGDNTITVVVTAQDSSTNTYTVTVNRAASSNANLSNLALSSGTLSPSFASGTTGYTASVGNAVTSLAVTPTVDEANATVTVNGLSVTSGSQSGSIALSVGDNTITVVVTAQDSSTNTYIVTVNRAASSNANLSNLTLSSGALSPSFASGTTGYTASVGNAVTSLTVTPTVDEANATVTVNGSSVTSGSQSGSIALSVGDNTITVVVTAQDSSTNTYTVTVNRAASSNANLSNLVLSDGTLSPVFAGGTTSYSASVSNSTTSITLTPTVDEVTATVTVNGSSVTSGSSSGSIGLSVGDNDITVIVTAQDSSTKTYTVTVNRAPSSNANLGSLALSDGTLSPSFASGTTGYTASVANAVTSLTVTPTVDEANATVTVNGSSVTSGSPSGSIALSVGDNTITVVVKAQDSSTKTYTVTVNRAASSNTNLSNLALSSGTLSPSFASGTTGYTASVGNAVTSLTVTPTVDEANATVTVNGLSVTSGSQSGSIALSVGDNTITVVVTAQDSSTNTYTVTVNRAASSNANLSNLTLSSGALSPSFASGTTGYTASVGNAVTSLTVTPTVDEANATVTVNGSSVTSGSQSGSIALSVGDNTITVIVTAQDSSTKSYAVTVNRAPSSNANLSALTLSSGTLTPVFASGTISYTADVGNDVTSITVTPTVEETNATVKVNGTAVSSGSASNSIALSVGDNTLTVIATAQDNTATKTYTITVNRAQSSNADLANLTVSVGSLTPIFASDTTSYDISVLHAVTSITVTPTLSDDTASVTVDGTSVTSGSASQPINLNQGDNSILITVTAEDSTTKSYGVVVNRAAPSDNANLSNATLSIGTLTPAFDPGTTSYNVNVDNDIASVTVTPNVEDNTASVTVNGASVASGSASDVISLSVGDNVITLEVLAEDSTTTKIYTVTVNRAQSSNADLSNLVISEGVLTPGFLGLTTDYTASVSYPTTSMTVSPTVGDNTASVTVNGVSVASGSASGPIALNVGSNTLNIVVTAENGATKTYTVTVERIAPSDNADLSALFTDKGTLNPVFDAAATDYSVTVANDDTGIKVTPTIAFGLATVKVNDVVVASGSASETISLTVGDNVITIVVTAEDGVTTKTYTVTVNRAQSSDADLLSLTTNAGDISPTFSSGVVDYAVSVAYTTTSARVTPTVDDAAATLTVNGASLSSGSTSEAINLSTGDNDIVVLVTAEDGTPKTYTLTINRAMPSTNANLESLDTSSGSLNLSFDSSKLNYTVDVSNSVTSINVTPVYEDSTASITVNGSAVTSGDASGNVSLDVGSNIIAVSVTAQDGLTVKTYTVNVVRSASSNADLSDLNISEGSLSPAFDSGTTEYAESVAKTVTSLTVTPIADHNMAKITVNGEAVNSGDTSGSISLNEGLNEISVIVTAEDNSSKVYALKITRLPSDNANLSDLGVSVGTLTPEFVRDVTAYSVSVINEVDSISLSKTLEDSSASYVQKVGGVVSGGAITLDLGDNVIDVEVTAENSTTTKTYSVTVNRAVVSSNPELSNLTMDSGEFDSSFASNQTSYTTSVDHDVTSVRLTPTVASLNSTVTVNGVSVTSGSASGDVALSVGDNVISVEVTAQDGLTKKMYTVTVDRAPSSNAYLSDLGLSNAALTPSFSSGTYFYRAEVANEVSSSSVTATLEDSAATVNINGTTATSGVAYGPISLHEGENTIEMLMRAQDGSTYVVYTIILTRLPSDNADLSGLVVDTGTLSPEFDVDKTEYYLGVENEATSINLIPSTVDSDASFTVDGTAATSGEVYSVSDLDVGNNVIEILVTAENGTTTKTYTVTVNRAQLSSLAVLTDLSVSEGALDTAFSSSDMNYTVSVSNDVTSIRVTPTVVDSESSVTVNGVSVSSGSASQVISLNTGDNVMEVEVTAEDGVTKRTYSIVVNRSLSVNTKLSWIAISDGALEPGFSSDVTEYVVDLDSDTAEIQFTAALSDANASIKINGVALSSNIPSNPIALDIGSNVITMEVTAEDGVTTNIYTITVNRDLSSDADLSGLTLSEGILTPVFSSATVVYTAGVDAEIETITLTPTLSDSSANLTVNGIVAQSGIPTGLIGLEKGDNEIVVAVTAEEGTVKTYTVTITRGMSSNANLSGLSISSGTLTPEFNSGTMLYSVDVDSEIAAVTLTPILVYGSADVTVNGVTVHSGTPSGSISLDKGDNEIYVVVTAEDGSTTKTYKVIVSRGLSSNASLSGFTISSGSLTPAFDENVTNYSVDLVNSTSSITIVPALLDGDASMTINGEPISGDSLSVDIPLIIGDNSIEIVITAEDGTTKTYTLVAKRAQKVNIPDRDKDKDRDRDEDEGQQEEIADNNDAQNQDSVESPPHSPPIIREGEQVTIIVKDSTVESDVDKENEEANVTVRITAEAEEKVIARLSEKIIIELGERDQSIEVQTEVASVIVPVDEVREAIKDAENISDVDIKVATLNEFDNNIVNAIAGINNIEIVSIPIEMSISGVDGDGETLIEITELAAYSQVTVEVEKSTDSDEESDANTVRTGIVVDADGTVHSVPTKIVEVDGKQYAKISSMETGTFVVVESISSIAIADSHWAAPYVREMEKRMVVSNNSEEPYDIDENITRAEFTTFVVRSLGLCGALENEFTDISDDDWYADEVAIGRKYGIISGYGDGTFRPNQSITRQESMAIIVKAMKIIAMDTDITDDEIGVQLAKFKDSDHFADWAESCGAVCIKEGVFKGRSADLVVPEDEISRAESITVLMKLLLRGDMIN